MSALKEIKFTILIFALLVEVEAWLYLGLAVWMIMQYECAEDDSKPKEVSRAFAMHLIYFSHRECAAPTIHIPKENLDVQLKIDYSKAEAISHRELGIFIVYFIKSIFWIISTGCVLATLCFHPSRKVIVRVFWFWFLCITVGSTLDFIATVFHIKDMILTSTAVETFEYVGIEYNEKVWKYIEDYNRTFRQPAILLTCCTTRFPLNMFIATVCFLLSRNLQCSNGFENNTLPTDSGLPQTRKVIPESDDTRQSETKQKYTVVVYFDSKSTLARTD